ALDIHVFKREGVFGTDQSGKRANHEGGVLPRLQLYKAYRYRTEEIGNRFISLHKRCGEGRHIVAARLKVELKHSVGLLNNKLTVGQRRLRFIVAWHGVPLNHAA